VVRAAKRKEEGPRFNLTGVRAYFFGLQIRFVKGFDFHSGLKITHRFHPTAKFGKPGYQIILNAHSSSRCRKGAGKFLQSRTVS